jgi:peptidoglycan/xylan/chitin deacetylase (PgdA/CDA1 family)
MNKHFASLAAFGLLLLNILAILPVNAVSANLLANPSVETNASSKPTSWASDKWGTNTTAFSYLNTGHTGTHSLKTQVSSYSSGDAKWYPTAVAAKPSTSYTFSDWYQSNTASSVDVVVTTTNNTTQYLWQGDLAASSAWKQAAYTFTTPANAARVTVYHYIYSVGQLTTDDYSLVDNTTATTPPPAPTPTAPTVSVTAPTAGTSVTGTTTVSANASDAQSVSSVQFKLDGANLGAADITAPYSTTWDTTTATNGSHSLTAVATNNSSLSTTSSVVSVSVNNTVPTPTPTPTPTPVPTEDGTNLVPNGSFETAADATTPQGWTGTNWGSNTSQFSYLNTGHTGDRSVEVQTTSFTNGAANWSYPDVAVSAGKTYRYTNWYKSNVETEVDAEVVMNDGTTQYFWLGNVPASTSWTKFSTTFTVPASAKSMSAYQILAKVGYVISDDYSLAEYTPTPFNRALVSVTFDDGWTNQYTNAYPVMQKNGLTGTYYIISGELADQPDYMSVAQIKKLYASGNEIGSHSITHPDLTLVTKARLIKEMATSKSTLQTKIGAPVTNFAYPFGAYNSATIAAGKDYYRSQRSVNGGLNTKDSLDLTQLKIHEVDSNITNAQVKDWVDTAVAQHAWLILVYHEVANTPIDPTDGLYTTTPADFATQMTYLKSTGVTVKTVNQALDEVTAQ